MQLQDLDFQFPQELIAVERAPISRALVVDRGVPASDVRRFRELSDARLVSELFAPGDVLVVNNTKVLARRVFSPLEGLEVLFLGMLDRAEIFQRALDPNEQYWRVLSPTGRWPKWNNAKNLSLPDGREAALVQNGQPQVIRVRPEIGDDYFARHAELPLPPYILKSRGEKHARAEDQEQYQTSWAKVPGSFAAPTASLHFPKEFLPQLKAKGVEVCDLTLHVGLGTFLPITGRLEQHEMHSEEIHLQKEVWQIIQKAKASGGKIWALGTTVVRTLESIALGEIPTDAAGDYRGSTKIFIKPGFEFQIVDRLMTNFHQPQSTLLALVAAFSDLATVRAAYAYAIEKKFRLFSYGDLSVWI